MNNSNESNHVDFGNEDVSLPNSSFLTVLSMPKPIRSITPGNY